MVEKVTHLPEEPGKADDSISSTPPLLRGNHSGLAHFSWEGAVWAAALGHKGPSHFHSPAFGDWRHHARGHCIPGFPLPNWIPDKCSMKEAEFHLAQVLKRFGPWAAGCKAEASWRQGAAEQSRFIQDDWEAEMRTVPERKGKGQETGARPRLHSHPDRPLLCSTPSRSQSQSVVAVP